MAAKMTAAEWAADMIGRITKASLDVPEGQRFNGGPLHGASVYNVYREAQNIIGRLNRPERRQAKPRKTHKMQSAEFTFYLVRYGQEVKGQVFTDDPGRSARPIEVHLCNDYASSSTGALVSKVLISIAFREWQQAKKYLDRIIALECHGVRGSKN